MIDIRKKFKKNLCDIKSDELLQLINNSIKDKNDLTLVGAGILFETLWINSDENSQLFIINTIINHLN